MQDLFHGTISNIENIRVPYQGSKNSISQKLMYKMLEIKPNAKYFVDICGGGGSMSFTALQMGLQVLYNDYDADLVNFLKYAFERIENNEKSKFGLFPEEWYKFATREEFIKQRDEHTPYSEFIRICYSFGTNRRNYAFAPEVEIRKHLAHNIIVFQCEKSCREFNERYNMNVFVSKKPTWNERRFDYMSCFTREQRDNMEEIMQSLQSLESLERLERLERLTNNIEFHNLSYQDVKINFPIEETIVYCDIPYRGTAKYRNANFNHDAFDKWFEELPYLAFLSEYNAPFQSILEIPKRKLMSGGSSNYAMEKLFINHYASK